MKDYAGTIKMQEGRHRKTSLEKYSPLNLFVRFACERCWRSNINIIFWPHCYDRYVVSCSSDVGVHSIRAIRGPLGRVWLSLPHLVSTLWESAGNCFGTPNSTELNNNSTPKWTPTGSLNRMFNRHQAEITVMQFRGHSLPLHDCTGRMGPWPCPIS